MIRELKANELMGLVHLAKKFYASSEFLSGFNADVFRDNWNRFIESGMGVIFVIEDNGRFLGAIGGCKYPDPNSGEWTASEFFWFVDESCRGKGLHLLKRFEAWAKEQGCRKIIMVHLSDLMPEKIKRVYERFGYKEMEIHYSKGVV